MTHVFKRIFKCLCLTLNSPISLYFPAALKKQQYDSQLLSYWSKCGCEFCVKELLWSVICAVWSSRKASWAHIVFFFFSASVCQVLLPAGVHTWWPLWKYHKFNQGLQISWAVHLPPEFLNGVSKQSAAWRLTVRAGQERNVWKPLSLSVSPHPPSPPPTPKSEFHIMEILRYMQTIQWAL